MDVGGGGLISLQSILTIIKGPFNFQSNEPQVSTTINDHLIISITWILGKYELWGWGGIHPQIALNLEKGAKTFDYQSDETLRS